MAIQKLHVRSPVTRYTLEDSYVLSVSENETTFSIHLLAAVRGGNPAPGSAYEYEILVVLGHSTSVDWSKIDMVPKIDPDGSVDFGFVEELAERETHFLFRGECGEFRAELAAPMEYYVLS